MESRELADIIARFSKLEGENQTPIPGVTLFKATSVEAPLPSVYDPCLCIIAQGSKEVRVNNKTLRYKPSQFLAVGVDLPILNRILTASKKEPYLLMKIAINLQTVSELILRSTSPNRMTAKSERQIFVGHVDQRMGDCILRLARLLETPSDIPVLAEQTLRELFYYVLQSENGETFAQIAMLGSHTQRVASAIQKIKNEFSKSIRIEDLANLAGMSVSAFHANFKLVTNLSPLQFQKKLRLIEARQLLSIKGMDAASTAYAVGYESPSQFSREYSRMFGNSPGKDSKKSHLGIDSL